MEQMAREFRDSGLNGREFCRRQGLAPSVLYRCLRRERPGGKSGRQGLVAVEVASQDPGRKISRGGLWIELAKGRRVVVEVGFDGATLRRLVQALETM